MASAADVGKKLLGEVEACGFDEILNALRLQVGPEKKEYFKCPPIDRLLQAISENRLQTSKTFTTQPMIEFMSLGPGGGKTHLIYHMTALATLPIDAGGRQACVIILDTDNKYSVRRLSTQMKLLLQRHNPDISGAAMETEILTALKHTHIIRPQSLPSTVATLESLPNYLFNQSRHYSFDREVALIALDSASTFYWQDRAESEEAAFLASTSNHTSPTQTSAFVKLSHALKAAMKAFDCPSVVTTWYLGPQQRGSGRVEQRSYRPPIQALQGSLRVAVNRVPVKKFPTDIGLEGAMRESEQRRKAVKEGRFECFVNEWGLDDRALKDLRGGGFEFRILDDGLVVDENSGDPVESSGMQ